jgi:pimeloyl-ACP methyl ester carboxylesterase
MSSRRTFFVAGLNVVLLATVASACASRSPNVPRVRSGSVDVEGGEIFYEVAGSGAAVVLVHGGFGDRRMWDDHFLDLARHHHVVRYDLRGFGRSPAPSAPYSPVDDLRRLLDQLDVRSATLIGNSMGGALALDFALVHPDRVEGLVLVASGVGGFPETSEDQARFGEEIATMRATFQEARVQGATRGIELWLQSPMVTVASQLPSTRDRLRQMITDNSAIFQLDHWPIEPLDPPAIRRLGEIRVPTMVVAGELDTPWMRAASERASLAIPSARLVIVEGADHLPQMVAPPLFRAALQDYFERQRRSRPAASVR